MAVSALFAAACDGTDQEGSSTGDDSAPQWLFAHSSESAEFEDNGDGTWDTTLIGPEEALVAFTDRPDRQAAMVTVVDFVDSWGEGFGDVPPNAAVTDHALEGGAVAVTLTAPRLGTDNDSGDATLSFTATVLADEDGIMPTLPATIAGVTTLIDPPAARLTNFHQMPLTTPVGPVQIPHVGGPIAGPGAPNVLIGGLPAAKAENDQLWPPTSAGSESP